jgi:hypothetical protein
MAPNALSRRRIRVRAPVTLPNSINLLRNISWCFLGCFSVWDGVGLPGSELQCILLQAWKPGGPIQALTEREILRWLLHETRRLFSKLARAYGLAYSASAWYFSVQMEMSIDEVVRLVDYAQPSWKTEETNSDAAAGERPRPYPGR